MDQATIVTLLSGAVAALFGSNLKVIAWCKQRYENLEKRLEAADALYAKEKESLFERIKKLEVLEALLNACPRKDCPVRDVNRGEKKN